MKQKLKTWVVVLAIAAAIGCNGQWSSNTGEGGGGGGQGRNKPHATEDEIRQQFEKLMSAFARRDINGVNEMMAAMSEDGNPRRNGVSVVSRLFQFMR